MMYVAVFLCGFLSAILSLIGIGYYAFSHPRVLAPIMRKMTRELMGRQ